MNEPERNKPTKKSKFIVKYITKNAKRPQVLYHYSRINSPTKPSLDLSFFPRMT